ncbi:thioesterase family protein [Nocardiopsis sp. YSL2]|uniref:thioesterase family protein n=1 Tax=Nocardiopsis sp. YSL2 TaxID=2939492 RepID=UPI0026F47A73|nr:thioesterase family protein [Nocardiopsis sp. YSL2]
MESHSQTLREDTRTTVFAQHWAGFGGTHGGLVAAGLQQAVTDLLGGTPGSLSAHFLEAVPPGPTEISVRELRGGRSASALAAIDGRASALVRFSHSPGSAPTVRSGDGSPPEPRPDPLSLERFTLSSGLVAFGDHVDIRPLGASRPLAAGTDPAYEAWIRLVPQAPGVDHLDTASRRLILIDAMPPGLFAVWDRPAPVPTLELSVHFAPCHDDSPWHLVRHRTVWASADLCVDETTLHTRSGELAAQGRQLRRVLPV